MKFTFPPESQPLDGYTIKRGIHRGGFGEVYYALSNAGKEVALKLLQNNADVELRGVRHCLNLKHPNLVTIFDIRQDSDEDHWIIMEFVSGQTLDAVVASHSKGMPIDSIRQWADGIIAGLSFLHDRGIVHRDLKPANVYEEQGIVKIGDVGLSKFISQSRRGAQTQSVGTVYYMAPEVARGSYGREVDIYALGVMLFEMLTGNVPFDGETTGEILMKHLSERPDVTRVPKPFRNLLSRALEKDPLKRYSSVEDFDRDFQLALNGEEAVALPEAVEVQVASAERVIPTPAPKHHRAKVYQRAGGRNVPAAKARAEVGREWTWWERHGNAMKAAAVLVGAIVLFSNGRFFSPAWNELVLYGCAVGVLYWMTRGTSKTDERRLQTGAQKQQDRPQPTAVKNAAVKNAAIRNTAARPAAKRHTTSRKPRRPLAGERLTPETHRHVSLKSRVEELSGSLTVAAMISTLITFCLYSVTSFLPTLESAAVFGFTTLAASWVILSTSKIQEGGALDRNSRRLLMLTAGLLVGAIAFGVDQFLLVDFQEGSSSMGWIQSVGRHDLMASGQPTLAGYMVFFGGLLGLRRWWWHADSFRTSRFRVSTTLVTLILAFMLSCVFSFPQSWGMLWAVAISCVVQLSAMWTPPQSRVIELTDAAVA